MTKLKAVRNFVVGAKHKIGTHKRLLAAQRAPEGGPSGLKCGEMRIKGREFLRLEDPSDPWSL